MQARPEVADHSRREAGGAGALTRDRVIVSVAAVVWVLGTLVGMGQLGGSPVAQQGEGLFSDHATLIAPHGPAFTIWPVIYCFLAAYVVWQWLPPAARSRWAGASRLPAAASLALNGLWLVAVYAGWIGGSVVVMAGLVVALGTLLRQIAALPADGATARVVVGVTFGLYLGWICVATCANIASWLVGLGVAPAGPAATAATIAVLVVVVLLAGLLLRRTPHRTFATALAGAIAWGLAWVAVGRFVGELANQPVAYAAVAAAVAVVALWGLRMRSDRRTADSV